MAITFKELKPYIARTVRISICFHDGHYDNYTMISDIPDGRYDDLYVFGVGMVDVEFPNDVYKRPFVSLAESIHLKTGYYLGCGLEIVLQEELRDIARRNENFLLLQDLRDYLQIGRHFSVVMKEDWSSEYYEWKRDIPEDTDDLYVYGIRIEDLPYKLKDLRYAEITDTALMKQMVIVLARTPREDVIQGGK